MPLPLRPATFTRLAFAASDLGRRHSAGPRRALFPATPKPALDLAPQLINPLLNFAWTALLPPEILERHGLHVDLDINRDGALLRFGGRI